MLRESKHLLWELSRVEHFAPLSTIVGLSCVLRQILHANHGTLSTTTSFSIQERGDFLWTQRVLLSKSKNFIDNFELRQRHLGNSCRFGEVVVSNNPPLEMFAYCERNP